MARGDDNHDTDDVPTSQVDQETIARRLAQAASEGHISSEELESRLARAHEARTYSQLQELVRDLPQGEEPVLQTFPEHTVPETLYIGAALRDAHMRGQWAAPRRIVASAGRGTVHLDFTGASLYDDTVTVDARPNVANVEVIVPEGYAVTTEDATPGATSVRDLTGAAVPDRPRIHIVAQPGLGDIIVRHPRAAGTRRMNPLRLLRRGKQ